MKKATIFKGPDGLFYWHMSAPNGEVIAQGEGYQNRADILDMLGKYFDDFEVNFEDDDGRLHHA